MALSVNKAALSIAAVMVCAASLGGCSSVGDSFASPAFVDPARYDNFDCPRLKDERISLKTLADAKQAMIDKAGSVAGGAIVGEAVYRTDYVALRAYLKLANELWVRNSCDAVIPPDPPKADAAAKPAATSKKP